MNRFGYLIAVFVLSGCSTTAPQNPPRLASSFINREYVTLITKRTYAAKSPQQVAFFSNKQTPISPYRVIGIATVSKYNWMGIKRKPNTLQAMMKNLAASVGGDALINVNEEKENVKAHIIQFQKILL